MKQKILGSYVHFADIDQLVTLKPVWHQGEVIATWLAPYDTIGDQGAYLTARVTVLCSDNRYRDEWLDRCVNGTAPKPEDEE